MKLSLILSIFVLCFSIVSKAQVHPQLEQALDSVLEHKATEIDKHGVTASVGLPDGDIWTGASGLNSATDSISADMILGIASNTKTFVSVLILQLQEEGLVSLDDSLHQWIGEFPNVNPNIRIRQLLNHTSGVFNYTNHPNTSDSILADYTRIWELEEVLDNFVNEPYYEPGDDYTYSNTNYVLAGLVIESVTGNEVSEEIRNRIFDPLNMEYSYYFSLEEYAQLESSDQSLAHGWTDEATGELIDVVALGLSPNSTYSFGHPAGSILSNAEDIAKWYRALFFENFLEPASFEQLTDIQDFGGVNYGLGLREYEYDGEVYFGHGGDKIYKSKFVVDMDDNLSIHVLFNDSRVYTSEMNQTIIALRQAYDHFINTVSVHELAHHNDIKVYPNPASSVVTLEVPEPNGTLTIRDQLGKVIRQMSINSKRINLDVNSLSPGLYIAEIQTKKGLQTARVVVEN